jgi:hypothetical protein
MMAMSRHHVLSAAVAGSHRCMGHDRRYHSTIENQRERQHPTQRERNGCQAGSPKAHER